MIEIRNIRRVRGKKTVYANLYVNGQLEISATLAYITQALNSGRFQETMEHTKTNDAHKVD